MKLLTVAAQRRTEATVAKKTAMAESTGTSRGRRAQLHRAQLRADYGRVASKAGNLAPAAARELELAKAESDELVR